jgi:hypothetical protein
MILLGGGETRDKPMGILVAIFVVGAIYWGMRGDRGGKPKRGSKSIALTTQRTEGQVMREIMADLRRKYPSRPESWRWEQAKRKMKRWGSDRRWD